MAKPLGITSKNAILTRSRKSDKNTRKRANKSMRSVYRYTAKQRKEAKLDKQSRVCGFLVAAFSLLSKTCT